MLTTALIIIAIFAVIGGFALIFVTFDRRLREIGQSQAQNPVFTMLNQNIQGMQERIDKSSHALNERLDTAARVISGVQKELGGVQEIGRSIKDFQQFINSPKLRGNISEQILADSLGKVFSKDHYDMQYHFKDGQIVDAVIKSQNGIIPIDAKFPMENYRRTMEAPTEDEKDKQMREFLRAVRKHIDDVARKYILPIEGTVDFAVMYVPSENIYYEIIMREEDIMEFARSRKVLLVSPNSFFHFLRVIMMGLEGAKLQEEAGRIWELLKGIQQETEKFGDALSLASKHLNNAKNAMDGATSEFGKLSSKVDAVKLLK